MPQIHETWTVLSHGPSVELDDGTLTVTGQIHMPLMDLERRMTVVRLSDGSSVIYSAIALGDVEMNRIKTFGEPQYLIVPGDKHRLDAKIFKQRYPSLQIIAPPGASERVSKVVPVDATSVDFGDPDVTSHVVSGTGGREASLLVRRRSGTTLILSDLVGNLHQKRGFEGWLLHVAGFAGDHPQIPRVVRMLLVENKGRLRQQLLEWAAIPDLRRIIMSHGDPIETHCGEALRKLAAALS